MAKETRKLAKAILKLHITGKPTLPNITYYGRLAEQGYTWNGEDWVRRGVPVQLNYPVQLRVMAERLDDIEAFVDYLQESLSRHGFHVQAKVVRENHTGAGFRAYLDVE